MRNMAKIKIVNARAKYLIYIVQKIVFCFEKIINLTKRQQLILFVLDHDKLHGIKN